MSSTEIDDVDNILKKIISDMLDVDEETINNKSSCHSIENWKGLKHRQILQAIENKFNIKFDPSEIDTLISYKIIKVTLIAHLA